MPSRIDAFATGFNADQPHVGVGNVVVENAHGVRPAPHAGENYIRLASDHLWHLRKAFFADDRIEIAHHHRIRMRPGHGADDVKSIFHIRHPVAHRLVQCVLQRL